MLVAKFLQQTRGLNKAVIGDFLAKDAPFNARVMDAYFEDLDLAGLRVDEALRAFVGSFRLSGEAGPINYMMEKFSELYVASEILALSNRALQPFISTTCAQIRRTKPRLVSRRYRWHFDHGVCDFDAEYESSQPECSTKGPHDVERIPGAAQRPKLSEGYTR